MKKLIIIISFIFLIINGSYYKETTSKPPPVQYKINPLLLTDFSKLRDTVYTMKNHIVEINLTTHKGVVRFRNGKKITFPISAGTKLVEDGIETREGLYVIHWKSKLQYSTQFDSTKLLYWMSFNGGIGLHALTGNSYYKYLGKKNVSHGCVRLSREDAEKLYRILEKGTPVLVHKGESAVVVEFGKLGEVYKYYSYKELKKLIRERLTNLYHGEYFLKNKTKILIDEENIAASGLPIGNANRIASRQIIPPDEIYLTDNVSEIDKVKRIFYGDVITNSNLFYNRQLDSLFAQR